MRARVEKRSGLGWNKSNIWVNNVLESLTEFLRAHINDSLEKLHLNCVFLLDSCPLLVPLKKCLVSVKTIPRVLKRYFVNG